MICTGDISYYDKKSNTWITIKCGEQQPCKIKQHNPDWDGEE